MNSFFGVSHEAFQELYRTSKKYITLDEVNEQDALMELYATVGTYRIEF